MVDAISVTSFHCVDDLEEDLFDECVVPPEETIITDFGEKIATRAIVEDDVNMMFVVEVVQHGDNVGVIGHGTVQDTLPFDIVQFPLRKTSFAEDFNGHFLSMELLGRVGFVVDGTVDDAIGTRAELLDALVTTMSKVTTGEVDGGDTSSHDVKIKGWLREDRFGFEEG